MLYPPRLRLMPSLPIVLHSHLSNQMTVLFCKEINAIWCIRLLINWISFNSCRPGFGSGPPALPSARLRPSIRPSVRPFVGRMVGRSPGQKKTPDPSRVGRTGLNSTAASRPTDGRPAGRSADRPRAGPRVRADVYGRSSVIGYDAWPPRRTNGTGLTAVGWAGERAGGLAGGGRAGERAGGRTGGRRGVRMRS